VSTCNPILGFIGLGAMGGLMTANLLRAGYTVHAFDLLSEQVAAVQSQSARPEKSVAAWMSENYRLPITNT
jgi:3-hydroxyisobutyrate dehydrogenase-like beta-hydroxyacid dehydrogenase